MASAANDADQAPVTGQPEELPDTTRATDSLEEFLSRIGGLRPSSIPRSEQIVAETFARLRLTPDALTPDQVRTKFNVYLQTVFEETLITLENYERPFYGQAVNILFELRRADLEAAYQKMLVKADGEAAFVITVQQLIESWYYYLRQMFLSISQSRKTRGGKDFELQLAQLLSLAGFPFENQHREHRVDFMLPNYAHYSRDRTQCVLLSAKRTLRERWQEVVDELHKMNCPNVFLATADKNITRQKMRDIARRNIKLVVFDDVKDTSFTEDSWVMSYTQLATQILPQLQSLYW